MTLPKNTMLMGRYRIDAELSRGGMGTVYRAFDTNLQTPVALKENAFQTEYAVTQFEREALILARLRHPSLPRVIQHFTEDDKQYLVMDFVEGSDLWDIIEKQDRPLNGDQAINCIVQICGAVAYLHSQSPPIIHRDIKPQNIKITPEGQAVLVDFGIAKEHISGEKTMTGAQGVTPGFSPPEQYGGRGTGSFSDIYSLGATLYALLTGQVPPDSISLVVGKQKFTPVNINPTISPEVSQAISWAMELQTTKRPSTVQVWQQKLRQIEVKKTVVSPTPPVQPTVVSPTSSAQPTGFEPGAGPSKAPRVSLADKQGYKYPLDPNKRLSIGRLPTSDIRINSAKVSRRHALVALVGQRCYIYDEGSSNGTFVNHQRVGRKGAEFRPGDVLTIGYNDFQVVGTPISPSSPVTPPPAPPAYAPPSAGTPPVTPGRNMWDDQDELGGIAGMTQMLTINIAKKMEEMSNTQVALLAIVLIGGMVLATFLVGDFIRATFPWLWVLFPFYYIAGPVAYVLSRRKGTAALVHIPTHIFVAAIGWLNPEYLSIIISGIIGGATMEGVFGIPKLPDWIRYPGGVAVANAAGLFVLILSGSYPFFNYGEIIGAAGVGFLVYFISEIQKGVQRARTALRS